MTTSTVITTTTDISLPKLVPCTANVRRTAAGAGIEALAASIQAHGLLQSLVGVPRDSLQPCTLRGDAMLGDGKQLFPVIIG